MELEKSVSASAEPHRRVEVASRYILEHEAFTFKGNKTRDHIRRQLPDVRYVLDGVVSISAGNALRITAELEDLNTGLVVWDKDYEGRTDDTNLFAMQSGIAAAVSDSLKVAILAEESRVGRVSYHEPQGVRVVRGGAVSAGSGQS